MLINPSAIKRRTAGRITSYLGAVALPEQLTIPEDIARSLDQDQLMAVRSAVEGRESIFLSGGQGKFHHRLSQS